MKKKNLHKIELITKLDGQISTGANTRLLLDGKPVKGVTRCTINVEAKGLTKVTLELLGYVEVNVLGELSTKVIKFVEEK